jgi:hypothetical protein
MSGAAGVTVKRRGSYLRQCSAMFPELGGVDCLAFGTEEEAAMHARVTSLSEGTSLGWASAHE